AAYCGRHLCDLVQRSSIPRSDPAAPAKMIQLRAYSNVPLALQSRHLRVLRRHQTTQVVAKSKYRKTGRRFCVAAKAGSRLLGTRLRIVLCARCEGSHLARTARHDVMILGDIWDMNQDPMTNVLDMHID
ncbi:MAG: hypothetical protein ACE5HE_11440, partial [Phycisphaerae bacterium]